MGFRKPDNLGPEIPQSCQMQPHAVNAFVNTPFPMVLFSKIKSRFKTRRGAFFHFHGKKKKKKRFSRLATKL